MNKIKKILLLMISFLLLSCPLPQGGESTYLFSTMFADTHSYWTIMYYVAGDNDLEQALLNDMEELSKGLAGTEMINVIALVDRHTSYTSDSSILGANFTDTRLYRIGSDSFHPLSGEEFFPGIRPGTGEERNMGDAQTLKSFIEYCKKYFPADRYGLIFSNHGSGVRSYSGNNTSGSRKGGSGLASNTSLLDKSIAYDANDSYDSIYTAELTDVLDVSHSVDLLVYDACLMGLMEIAYQYRPGNGRFEETYMVASPADVWWQGYPYDRIFSRIFNFTRETGHDSTVTGISRPKYYYAPEDLTAERLGRIFVEEQKADYYEEKSMDSPYQVLALYDLKQAADVKQKLDLVAKDLKNTDKTAGKETLNLIRNDIIDYSSDPINSPHFDLHEFAISDKNPSDKVDALADAVDKMVLASFGHIDKFEEGTGGLGFFFPDGEALDDGEIEGVIVSKPAWFWQWWYTGEILEDFEGGKLEFCKTIDNTEIDSWFELLQYYYNPYNPEDPNEQSEYDKFHPGRY